MVSLHNRYSKQMKSAFEGFDAMFNELAPQVREKAIEIASQLLASGKFSDREEALKEGIRQAEEWFIDLEG